MSEIIFIFGGCRSGKSRHALELSGSICGKNRIFIATCLPIDEEMKQRVECHQKERGQGWTTIEAPVRLPEAIIENHLKADVIVVDCLTFWTSNIILETDDQETISRHIHSVIQSIETAQCTVILVANEVGAGIVPDNALARRFRDVAGHVNQNVAACSDKVIWMAAGIPVKIK
jgi:adenosylcobinamide kinase/adenosylcobinamide-phosphate guanylyltransferase